MSSPNHADRSRAIAGPFSDRVAAVDDAAWSNPSPCEGWEARDIVRHLVEWVPPFLAGSSEIRIAEGPPVDDDPVGAWTNLSDGIETALERDGIDDLVFEHEHIGRLPLATAVERRRS